MLTRSIQCAIVLTGMAAAAPQAAWADSKPSLIKVIGTLAQWTVTKVSPASDGKCKIYETEPVYSVLNNVQTEEAVELKEAGSDFAFKKDTSYWIVFFPKDRDVAVRLEFAKGKDLSANKTSLTVKGTFYAAKWWKGPEVAMQYLNAGDGKMSIFNKANFGKGITPKGKTPQVFLTLN